MKNWRIAGINFDHLHMGDLLREVYNHKSAEIVGICDQDINKISVQGRKWILKHYSPKAIANRFLSYLKM